MTRPAPDAAQARGTAAAGPGQETGTRTTDRPASAGTMSIHPAAGYLGAEVTGVDIGAGLDQDTIGTLRAALLEHKVLFLREQDLDHARHVAFARRWGEITRRPPPHRGVYPDGFPEILTIDPQADDDRFGVDFEEHYRRRWTACTAGWHTDLTPAVNPPAISVLRAEAVPSYGGDTQWTSLVAAYEGLAPPLQDFADGLRAEHAFFAGCEMVRHDPMDRQVLKVNDEHPLAAVHPVVRVHPETGEKALYVNPASTSRIIGLSTAESRHVLGLFFEQLTRPEYTVRFRWEPGSVAIWDNRATAHLGAGDFSHTGEPRRLHRVTILGDRPAGPDGFVSQIVAGEPFYPLIPEGT